jgi:hypothetical protein
VHSMRVFLPLLLLLGRGLAVWLRWATKFDWLELPAVGTSIEHSD